MYINAHDFTRGAALLRAQQPLTESQIMSAAPSVFASSAHESRSDRYAYIPTADILRGLAKEGFDVYSAKQSRARSDEKAGHTKHMLRLRHRSMQARVVGDSAPEIVLVNSHDGSSSYQMMGGMYRLACSNGLVVPDSICASVRVSHTGKVLDRVTDGAFEVLDGLTRVIENRDEMRAIALTGEEQAAFANAAAILRFDSDYGEPPPVTAAQLNRARRADDAAGDLWSAMNRVQENAIKGGLRGMTRDANGRTKTRRTREVTGIDQDVRLNRAIWALAEQMRAIKAAH